MKNPVVQKLFAFMLSAIMLLAVCAGSLAETSTSDLQALQPLMDAICCAAEYSDYAPEHIGDASSTMTTAFAKSFLIVAADRLADLKVTNETLVTPKAQKAVLSTVFAAQIPELEAISSADETEGYIGFVPMQITDQDGMTQVIGEMYCADKPIAEMSGAEFGQIQWMDRALFQLQKDSNAYLGYRVTGFGPGIDLSFEEEFQNYYDTIVFEYQSALDFTCSIPRAFEDICHENAEGITAEAADGSLSFKVVRADNANLTSLTDYVSLAAANIEGSVPNVNLDMQYGTLRYLTNDGYTVFEVYVVTDSAIYQAQLRYLTANSATMAMFEAYLENSFVVTELSQG